MQIRKLFTIEGAHIVIADFDKEAGFENEKYIKEKNGSAMFIETNVGDEGSVK